MAEGAVAVEVERALIGRHWSRVGPCRPQDSGQSTAQTAVQAQRCSAHSFPRRHGHTVRARNARLSDSGRVHPSPPSVRGSQCRPAPGCSPD
jgi:hypothetical protein